jgi:hypothetical protein
VKEESEKKTDSKKETKSNSDDSSSKKDKVKQISTDDGSSSKSSKSESKSSSSGSGHSVNGPHKNHLTKSGGVFAGPSGKETYYNLDMSGVVRIMRNAGFSAKEYPYWVRSDGVKMLGDYVMVAANLSLRPRGSIVESSLGTAIVCDTGGFARTNKTQLDIAVSW